MCLSKSCIRHQPLKMLEQDCRFVTLRRNALEKMIKFSTHTNTGKSESFCSSPYAELSKALTLRRNALETNANSQKTQVLEKSESFCSSPYAELSKALMRVPGSVHTSVCPTVCQHIRRLPNCLPALPNTHQLFANLLSLSSSN